MSKRGQTNWVLGVSASHNGAACLLRDGEIAVAIQEERISRLKRDRIEIDRPSLAVQYCLDAAGIGPGDLAAIVICRQGGLWPDRRRVLIDDQLAASRLGTPVLTLGHHAGHMASAIAMSGFDTCAGLVIDGQGYPAVQLTAEERAVCHGDVAAGWESISTYRCEGSICQPLSKHLTRDGAWISDRTGGMRTFQSLGGMYSAVADQIFGDASEAGHVMGLAPYGAATIPPSEFFAFEGDDLMFKDAVCARFPDAERWPARQEDYQNLSASVQAALEEAILEIADRLWRATRCTNLCFAGGVALNAVVNERLHRETPFEHVFIPAAAEDSGPAIGAAYHGYWSLFGPYRPHRVHTDSFGRRYSEAEKDAAILRVPGLRLKRSKEAPYEETATRLAGGEVCGWFQNGSELGPRALGNRSILADPRSAETKERLNRKVKFRAPFRPFAPAVLAEKAADWFEMATPDDHSEFMLRVWPLRKEARAKVPAVVHADGTGRAQTVASDAAPEFHRLISAFDRLTGVPILVNTSFNINREPIVETPEDALWCFLMTNLDFCVIGDRIVDKAPGRDIILDLRPRRRDVQLQEMTAAVEPDGRSPLAFSVETPWGASPRRLSPAAHDILQRVDGSRTVRDLGLRITAELDIEADDAALVQMFAALRRSGLIDFEA